MHQNNTGKTTHRDGERGQAMVEFALVLPVLCLVMFAVFEFGQAWWDYQQLSSAASEGARKAIVSRNDANKTTAITTAVKDNAPGLDSGSVNVNITSTWSPGSTVTVTATYPEDITIMGTTLFHGNLSSSRTARVEQ
jgi:Flp pilus assembly protein TadG